MQLNSFLIGEIGYIPSIEERPVITYKNHLLEVMEVTKSRIEKVIVTINDSEITVKNEGEENTDELIKHI